MIHVAIINTRFKTVGTSRQGGYSGGFGYSCEILFLKLFFFFFFNLWLCWVFVAAHGLSLVAVHGFLIAVGSLVAEHGL